MGQVLHGSAKTTHAIRGKLQRSQASVASLAKRFRINEKTVIKWRKRQSVEEVQVRGRLFPIFGDLRDLIVAEFEHRKMPFGRPFADLLAFDSDSVIAGNH